MKTKKSKIIFTAISLAISVVIVVTVIVSLVNGDPLTPDDIGWISIGVAFFIFNIYSLVKIME